MCLMPSKEKLNCLDFIFNFMVVAKFSNVGVSSMHLSMDGMPAMHRTGNIVKTEKKNVNASALKPGSLLPLDNALIATKSANVTMINKTVTQKDMRTGAHILLWKNHNALSFF